MSRSPPGWPLPSIPRIREEVTIQWQAFPLEITQFLILWKFAGQNRILSIGRQSVVRICCYGDQGRTCGDVLRRRSLNNYTTTSLSFWPTSLNYYYILLSLVDQTRFHGQGRMTLSSFCAPSVIHWSAVAAPQDHCTVLLLLFWGAETCPFSGHVSAIRFSNFHPWPPLIRSTAKSHFGRRSRGLCTSPQSNLSIDFVASIRRTKERR